MVRPTRDALVLESLQDTGQARVSELAERLEVGEATIRRSLQRLADDGRVIRTYGGATVAYRSDVELAGIADDLKRAKRAIGSAAADLVEDETTIALSSGSTVLQLARRLRDRRLTVITNALDVANVLLDAPGIELVVLGGVVLPGMHSLRGHLTEDALRDLRADTVFMGASAIDLHNGVMTEQVREIAVDRALRSIARHAVILADSSKFDRVAPGFMFGLDEVATIVTDAGIDPAVTAALRGRGVEVVIGQHASTDHRTDVTDVEEVAATITSD